MNAEMTCSQVRMIPAGSNKALALSFTSEVRQRHQEAIAAGENMRRAVQQALEKTRAVGMVLQSAESDLNHDEFKQLCSELPFSLDSVRSYLSFARKHPEPVTDLKVAMRLSVEAALTTGLLPAPERMALRLHEPNFISDAIQHVQLLAAAWAKYIKRKPLTEWRADEIDTLLATFAPIQRIYRTLNAEGQRRTQQ
jgi:hypothetical protein